jgi:hypothetical protein
MQMLAILMLVVLLVAALLIAIFKGSRPPQPIPTTPTVSKKAALTALVPVGCALISFGTYKAISFYLTIYLEPPKPWIIPMRIGWFLGVVAPWFVGSYFAYETSRAANKGLRAIGALEVLTCVLYGAVLLFASTVGFG